MKPCADTIVPKSPSRAIFLEAARRIGQGEAIYACCALDRASKIPIPTPIGCDSLACLWFNAVLKPPGASDYSPWYATAYNEDSSVPCEDEITARIIGLCLCAELLKDGFDPYE